MLWEISVILTLSAPHTVMAEPNDPDNTFPILPLGHTTSKSQPPTRRNPHKEPVIRIFSFPGSIGEIVFRLIKIGGVLQWTAEQTYNNTITKAGNEFLDDFAPINYQQPNTATHRNATTDTTRLILQKTIEYCFIHGLPNGPRGFVNYSANSTRQTWKNTQLREILQHIPRGIFSPEQKFSVINSVKNAMIDACMQAADIAATEALARHHSRP